MEGEHPELPHAILTKPYETAVLTHAINQALASRKHANPKPR
jgi:trehalose-6-phosphate synthase